MAPTTYLLRLVEPPVNVLERLVRARGVSEKSRKRRHRSHRSITNGKGHGGFPPVVNALAAQVRQLTAALEEQKLDFSRY
jgi:hypothetical protein